MKGVASYSTNQNHTNQLTRNNGTIYIKPEFGFLIFERVMSQFEVLTTRTDE